MARHSLIRKLAMTRKISIMMMMNVKKTCKYLLDLYLLKMIDAKGLLTAKEFQSTEKTLRMMTLLSSNDLHISYSDIRSNKKRDVKRTGKK